MGLGKMSCRSSQVSVHEDLSPNLFYQKKITRIVATQRTILLRLPFHVTDLLGSL